MQFALLFMMHVTLKLCIVLYYLLEFIFIITLDYLCSEITDIETALTAEIGDVISSNDYAAIFSNCCNILRYLF